VRSFCRCMKSEEQSNYENIGSIYISTKIINSIPRIYIYIYIYIYIIYIYIYILEKFELLIKN
jgi:hypothetical protein